VSRSYVIYIGLLAAFWGASYMFIKVAGRAFEPAAMIMLRLLIASSLLLVVLAVQRGWHRTLGEMRALGWEGFGLGVVNGAIPFTLIAWGERHIDSGVAAIANASLPDLRRPAGDPLQTSETVRGLRLAGFCSGSWASACSRACIPRAAGGESRGRSPSSSRRFRTRRAASGASG
jgi:hypothetical protein